jgi:hypothetical protein
MRAVVRAICLSAVVGVVAQATAAHAVPVTMRHQGRFIVGEGFPLQGAHEITVTLWDDPAAGMPVWSQVFTVDLTDGYYALTLGLEPGNPLDSAVLERFPLYLGLALDDGPEFTPRQEVVSVPYAILSDISESVIGGHADVSRVDIDGNPVIDAGGNWVGPPIYDGTDFALSGQSCPADELVTGISTTGTVTCQPVDQVAYTAGAGLTLTASEFAADFAGTGVATTVARSDHDHDATYLRRGATTDCAADEVMIGIDDATGNVVCAPDADTNTTYSAGAGLTLSGTTFHVVFAGTGTSDAAARADHDHDGRYLPVGGTTGCAPSQKVVAIDPATGDVTCAADLDTDTDTDTTYSAGAGLTLAGTTFAVAFGPGGSSDQAVRWDDPRLTDPRPPAGGSNNYIQNQFAADQPANMRISGQVMLGGVLHVGGGVINVNGKNSIQGTDSWLRLNQAGHYGSGTYTPGRLRADGGFEAYGAVTLHHCRLCYYYADVNGGDDRKTMCVKFTPNSFTGMMNLAGDVDDNDVVGMKYLCDNGPAGIFNGWPWQ